MDMNMDIQGTDRHRACPNFTWPHHVIPDVSSKHNTATHQVLRHLREFPDELEQATGVINAQVHTTIHSNRSHPAEPAHNRIMWNCL